MKKFNVGIIGLGARGGAWVKDILADVDYINIVGLCDIYEDRIKASADVLVEKGREKPALLTTDYCEIIDSENVEVVLIFSAWNNHFEAALKCMKAGKPLGLEVGGAYSISQCWDLVRTYQETKTPFMFLENCCYGEYELMVLNMVRHGLFGEIVHCEGAYAHDLRDEVARGNENRHYRFKEYTHRNAENYPTHEIGPISKILNINNGNRFVSLVSMASRSAGIHEYIMQKEDLKEKYANVNFKQGDIISTLIKCADGSTVSIKLDTSLPRYYSRNFTVRGTKGMYEENTQSVLIDGGDFDDFDWAPNFGNRKDYEKEWEHTIWHNFRNDGIKGGHGGMDFLVMDAFFEALDKNLPMPIDVYDAATWMAITALSERSIELGSQVMEFPDFTEGKWETTKDEPDWKYKLNIK